MIEFVIAEQNGVCGSTLCFEFFPLKRLNKRAIEIADSHGGDKSVWYRIDDWSFWLSMYCMKKKSVD